MSPVHSLLFIGAFLFSTGILLIVSRKNAIMVLLGLELLLNASNLNLVAFSHMHPDLAGQMTVLFVIVVAVCEAAVGLAIVLKLYHLYHTALPDDIHQIKE